MTYELTPETLHAEKKYLYVILGFGILSFITLTYQTYLFYVEGYCGCTANQTFDLYSAVWGIPISLIGMVGFGVSIVLAVFFLTVKDTFPFYDKLYQIFLVWVFFQMIAILFVLNMMYIAKGFCELCSVAQVSTFIIFIVLLRLLNKFRYYFYFNEVESNQE